MISAAKRSTIHLGGAAKSVVEFVLSQQGDDGGFMGRSSQSDLYYTLFALESLFAVGAGFDKRRTAEYLKGFGSGQSLDLVHLASLVRCLSNVCRGDEHDKISQIIERIENYRTADGGYSVISDSDSGSAYACFLALGAYEDAMLEMPNTDGVINCIGTLRKNDGGYANEARAVVGATPATAAAVVTLFQLDRCVDGKTVEWLFDRVSGSN
ncbi:MAG: hypothetical protein KAS23_14755, partial [Anaerohalosphaera sp.]|nr:hypothetical protein [Anaerohalosphaera sp.]